MTPKQLLKRINKIIETFEQLENLNGDSELKYDEVTDGSIAEALEKDVAGKENRSLMFEEIQEIKNNISNLFKFQGNDRRLIVNMQKELEGVRAEIKANKTNIECLSHNFKTRNELVDKNILSKFEFCTSEIMTLHDKIDGNKKDLPEKQARFYYKIYTGILSENNAYKYVIIDRQNKFNHSGLCNEAMAIDLVKWLNLMEAGKQ